MIDTVIFDLDGTLRDWEAAIGQALAELRPQVPEAFRDGLEERLQAATQRHFFDERGGQIVYHRHFWFDVDPLPPWRDALPGADVKVVEPLAQRFRELLDAVPFADVYPALEQLRQGYALGVLTNGPRPQAVLARIGFAHYFDAIVTVFGDLKQKPAAAAFETALDELDAEPATTAYVGDSILNDVRGALSAGLTSIWLDRYEDPSPPPEGAHRVETLTALPELLAELAD